MPKTGGHRVARRDLDDRRRTTAQAAEAWSGNGLGHRERTAGESLTLMIGECFAPYLLHDAGEVAFRACARLRRPVVATGCRPDLAEHLVDQGPQRFHPAPFDELVSWGSLFGHWCAL